MPSGRPSKAQKAREARREVQLKNDPDPNIDYAAVWDEIALTLTLTRAQKMVSRPVKAALTRLVASPKDTPHTAANAEGVAYETLLSAMRRPHVILLRQQIFTALREGWAQQAVSTFANIMKGNEKTGDRMRAAEFLAGIEGIAPTKRQEIQHNNAPLALGIQIVIPSLPGDTPLDTSSGAIEGQAIENIKKVGK